MKRSLLHLAPQMIHTGISSLALLALLTAATLVAPTATAQVVFDDFNDGNVDNVSAFAGGADGIGAGAGPGVGQDGAENTGLSVGVNPGAGGGFAGAAIVLNDGVDASEADYLTFYINTAGLDESNLPLTLEVNLQEDADGNGVYDGATEDEYQANYRLSDDDDYELVQIPLASFTDDNSVNAGADDGFEFSEVINVVFAFGGIPGGPEFTLLFDDIGFAEEATVSNEPGTSGAPRTVSVGGAYPNPFTAQTQFKVTLERAQEVQVAVYDVLGRQVALLHEGVLEAQTPHTFEINGQNLPSGMYLYRVTGEDVSETRSLILVK